MKVAQEKDVLSLTVVKVQLMVMIMILTGISLMKNARSDGGRLGPEEQLARSTSPGM